jgi:hypothetical protein
MPGDFNFNLRATLLQRSLRADDPQNFCDVAETLSLHANDSISITQKATTTTLC